MMRDAILDCRRTAFPHPIRAGPTKALPITLIASRASCDRGAFAKSVHQQQEIS